MAKPETTIDPEVAEILDGYFGESLEYSENEESLRKYLYEPLSKLTQKWREHFEWLENGSAGG